MAENGGRTAGGNMRLDRLIDRVVAEGASILRAYGRPPLAARVVEAMRRVPRQNFVTEDLQDDAFDNRPLPIGRGQTVSQPLMVAVMTDLLDLAETDRVLDVGTGSGYQAAVLAELAAEVSCLELEPTLLTRAAQRLTSHYPGRVHCRCGNGWFGWPDAAPFDAIVVAAAAPEPPRRLLDRLAPRGRMVLPLDNHDQGWLGQSVQTLVRFQRNPDGSLHRDDYFPCAFVPFRDRPDS